MPNTEALVRLALRKVEGNPKEVIWGGITARSFPPVVLPSGRTVVLRQAVRTGERGQLLWYEMVAEKGGPYLALALQYLE